MQLDTVGHAFSACYRHGAHDLAWWACCTHAVDMWA